MLIELMSAAAPRRLAGVPAHRPPHARFHFAAGEDPNSVFKLRTNDGVSPCRRQGPFGRLADPLSHASPIGRGWPRSLGLPWARFRHCEGLLEADLAEASAALLLRS